MTESIVPQLLDGYKKFKSQYYDNSTTYEELVSNGQKPRALLITCCDSRVDPAILLGAKPGELFVVRNVANLVPPFDDDPKHHATSAALEFAVSGLGVNDIIILGHSHCGGIHALMNRKEDEPQRDFITAWMNIAKPAKEKVLAQYPNSDPLEKNQHCEKESLLISLANLKTFPWIQERVAKDDLNLHAWYFNMNTGAIEMCRDEEIGN